MSPVSEPAPRADKSLAAVHARRVIFIDLARALAVVFMLYGHAVDALLAPIFRSGLIYGVWQFQRGLTSCLFLLLSGFAFSIATARHWATQTSLSPALVKRLRRFGLFVLLGYSLRIPVTPLTKLSTVSEVQWRSFLAVDVLQLIGVTFVGVQLLVLATRTRQIFMVTMLVLAGVMILTTPLAWETDWLRLLPLSLASYFSPATGSQFPLFPWAAFILIGAGLGEIYATWGAGRRADYANRILLMPAIVLLPVAFVLDRGQERLFGVGPYAFVPGNVLLRTGSCFLLLGLIAHGSRRLAKLPHVFGAVAQESLLIYFVHLCVVYGSIWSPGLAQAYGMTRTPSQMLLIVVVLIGAMTLLAWYWNWWKHTRPMWARWQSVAVGILLFLRLM
jgi:uncharacterized membrane protein